MIAKRRDQRSRYAPSILSLTYNVYIFFCVSIYLGLYSCSLGNSVASAEATENDEVQARQTIEKCNQSTFRSVTELSFGGERSSGLATVNMVTFILGNLPHYSSSYVSNFNPM